MISCDKHNTNLIGLFYSFFHNIEGPKLAVEYPVERVFGGQGLSLVVFHWKHLTAYQIT